VSYSQKVRANYTAGGKTYAVVIDNSAIQHNSRKTTAEMNDAIDAATGITVRHSDYIGNGSNANINQKVSKKFAVSPTDVGLNGSAGSQLMNFAQASGWENTTGNVDNNRNASATVASPATGCKAYAGPSGGEVGKWRLPTQREMQIMYILKSSYAGVAGFTQFTNGSYVTSTEGGFASYVAKCWVIEWSFGSIFNGEKTGTYYVRCVRDIVD